MRGPCVFTVAVMCATAACGPGTPEPHAGVPRNAAHALPDVRLAKERPPVVLVVRDGDPSGAIAFAAQTGDDAEAAVAMAGVIEARLARVGAAERPEEALGGGRSPLTVIVTPSWDGVRASVLVANTSEARAVAEAMRAAVATAIGEDDVVAAKRKLAALAMRPLGDSALSRWARCVGAPYAMPERVAKIDDVAVARVEAWRAAIHAHDRTAFAVTGTLALGDAVAGAIAKGPAWPAAGQATTTTAATDAVDVDVYESGSLGVATVHATIELPNSSAAIGVAEGLGDPRGPLAARLAGIDVPFRLREIAGTAHARGGCVGVVLEGGGDRAGADLAALAADAVALVHVEANARLGESETIDGRLLARRSGDAREAAERAAWWALVDGGVNGAKTRAGGAHGGSVVLGVPARRGSTGAPTKESFSGAMAHAVEAWKKPIVEARTRVEAGQGEAWVLFASTCGTDGETDTDAGLTALVTMGAAEAARTSPDVRVEPWIVPDGAGLVAHGPPLPGESGAAHARRLADTVARAFAGEPIAPTALGRARASLIDLDARGDGATLGMLANALAPGRPSAVVATGREEALARSSDAAITARAQALRAGPLRIAVIANVDAAQGDAAMRAADRWVDRRGGVACPSAMRAASASTTARPGTYSLEPRSVNATPEAYLAYPFPAGDDAARSAALVVAAALDDGLLARSLGALARTTSARVVGWPRAPALVVRVVAKQQDLDGAVMQARALVDRIHKGGLPAADHEQASAALARAALATSLDPRARVVATWRNEPVAPKPADADAVKSYADKLLGEDTLVVVASRPGRTKGAP
jgi:hypothetical protein